MPGRAGLAAPQIGVGLRAFSYNVDGEVGYVLNPVSRGRGRARARRRGLPLGARLRTSRAARYPRARVTGIDLDGNPIERRGRRPHGAGAAARDATTSTASSTSRARLRETSARRCGRSARPPGSDRWHLPRRAADDEGPRGCRGALRTSRALSARSSGPRSPARPRTSPRSRRAKSSRMTWRLMLIFGVRCPLASVSSVEQDRRTCGSTRRATPSRSPRRRPAAPRR